MITRPRCFGKTLNMSMLEAFFPWSMQTRQICRLIADLYNQNWYLIEKDVLRDNEKEDFIKITNKKIAMTEEEASTSLNNLASYLYRYYGKKVIIILDEYGYGDRKEEIKSW